MKELEKSFNEKENYFGVHALSSKPFTNVIYATTLQKQFLNKMQTRLFDYIKNQLKCDVSTQIIDKFRKTPPPTGEKLNYLVIEKK